MQIWLDERSLDGSSSFEKLDDAVDAKLDDAVDAVIFEGEDTDGGSIGRHPTYESGVFEFRVETTDDPTVDKLIEVSSPSDSRLTGIAVDISKEEGQRKALEAIGSLEWILASSSSKTAEAWRMIPAENLIGAASQTGTKIAFMVDQASDVVGLSKALQLGVDALCVKKGSSHELWEAVRQAKRDTTSNPVAEPSDTSSNSLLVEGECWRMPLSSGSVVADRICIDLVQTLLPTEGCWVGSSAKIMALVLSEAAQSQFVPSRPFRINAGPVHSYIRTGRDSTTKYLCELKAGDQVLVHDSRTGQERLVAVGRLKIEVRPCLLVGLSANDNMTDGQLFLQQAETVRLGQDSSSFVRVTELDGTSRHPVLLRVSSSGTHVGGRYTGKVEEK